MSEILAPARISDIFLYYGFDNGYVLNRFYGHTGLYGNHHPVKPYMIFFIFHSLPPPSQVRLDVRPSAWYSSLFTFHSERSEVTVPGTYKRRTVAVEVIMSLFHGFSLHFDFCNLDFLAIFENNFRLVANNRNFSILQTFDNQEINFYG